MNLKRFKSKTDLSTITVFDKGGQWFYKHTPFRKWIKNIPEIGPFKNEGDALLSICMSKEIRFSDFMQTYANYAEQPKQPEGTTNE